METINNLYKLAEDNEISVDSFDLNTVDTLSIMDKDGACSIAIDPHRLTSYAEEKAKLAHELGHCMTGSFYNSYSSCDCRARHEFRANLWATLRLVSLEDLKRAAHDGITEVWELAEYFDLPAEFISIALDVHRRIGNIA
jgi:Zn-dependent peptidase ImmA (M78 family)